MGTEHLRRCLAFQSSPRLCFPSCQTLHAATQSTGRCLEAEPLLCHGHFLVAVHTSTVVNYSQHKANQLPFTALPLQEVPPTCIFSSNQGHSRTGSSPIQPWGVTDPMGHSLGIRMEDVREESEMGHIGINWSSPYLCCPQHISYLQSSLHSMPMWEGNCTTPFCKDGGEAKGGLHKFLFLPQAVQELWRWVESKPCCPNLPSSQSPFLAMAKRSAIKLSLQKSVQTFLQYLSLPKAFFFFLREPTSSISWKPDPCLLLYYGIHCKAPIDTKRYDCIPHIHCS